MLQHRELEKRLSTSEEKHSTYYGLPIRTTLHQSPYVIYENLTVDNYKAKFCELLKYEQMIHADILRQRYVLSFQSKQA